MNKHRNPNGTYNGITAIADLSGLSRRSVFQIAADVKANHALLDACPYHEFSPILPRAVVNQRYRCIECGGEIDYHGWYWHQKGRRPSV